MNSDTNSEKKTIPERVTCNWESVNKQTLKELEKRSNENPNYAHYNNKANFLNVCLIYNTDDIEVVTASERLLEFSVNDTMIEHGGYNHGAILSDVGNGHTKVFYCFDGGNADNDSHSELMNKAIISLNTTLRTLNLGKQYPTIDK